MNFKKKNIALLAMAALFSLASCGNEGGASTNSDEVTVVFWHTMGKQNRDILQAMVKTFEKENPGIKINESSAAGGYPEMQELVLKSVKSETLPTMAFCYPDHVAEYLAAGGSEGIVSDMTSYINDPELGFTKEDGSHVDENGNEVYGVSDYVSTFWEEGSSYTKEGVYSVPFAKSTEALFYNKDAFEENGWEVPKTWDQMWDLCREIKAVKGDEIFAPLGYDSDSNLFISFCEQRNIPYTSATGTHYLFDNAEAKAMVADLKAKHDEGLFITKGSVENATYTSSKFTAGEILMSIGSTGGTTYNQTSNFTVGVAEPPAYDLSHKAVISQGPSICFFNGKSNNATPAQLKAAWKFYKFISSAENSTNYSISTGYQPVRTSSYETEAYKEFAADTTSLMNKVAGVSSNMLDSYFNSPVFVGSAKARTEVGSLMSAVLLGTKTVDEAFDQAISECVNSI